MELDLPMAGSVPTTPNLFLGIAKGWGGREDDFAWLLRGAVPMLTGRLLPAHTESSVLRCVRELPADGRVFQVGLMLARSTDAVRLCLEQIEPGDMAGYLLRAGWCGGAQSLEEETAILGSRATRLLMALNVNDRIAPRLGLECYTKASEWSPFLDLLTQRGLCVDGKREALLSFPKTFPGIASAPFYPEKIAQLTTQLGLWERRTVHLSINHLKFTLGGGLPPEVKGYFGVRYLWEKGSSEPQPLPP